MRASDFDYLLPPEQIAQHPALRRDLARLYVLPREQGEVAYSTVADLAQWIPREALLIINDTRVIPARLRGRKTTGGRIELLLLERTSAAASDAPWNETWSCMAGSSKPLRPGMNLIIDGNQAPIAEVISVAGAEAAIRFSGASAGGMIAVAERLGEVPLPPYITRNVPPGPEDRERYQTVYARAPGAAAAPTAGLHFTPELLSQLTTCGIEIAPITLHVGLGTFAPLRVDNLDELHELHHEHYEISETTCEKVARARAAGRPVIAVGTTSVRALESASDEAGLLKPGAGSTCLFIRPGYRFKVIDGLMTNFHLPCSTLLMLVAALVGRERILAAYADAVARGYRFFSYGDAMIIR